MRAVLAAGKETNTIGGDRFQHRTGDGDYSLQEVDTIVLAAGAVAYNSLEGELKQRLDEVYSVGDCDSPRNAGEAIHEAFQVAYRL